MIIKPYILARCINYQDIRPIDLGFPGYLPYLDGENVGLAIRAGVLLNCQIQKTSVFERKHYFYSDLPLGYQITQHQYPLARNGMYLNVHVLQIQLEQDSAKILRNDSFAENMIDFSRAGVGLIEIVTAPDFCSSAQVVQFAKNLRSALRDAKICYGNMELGQLRFDVNVSVSGPRAPLSAGPLGKRVEVKNLNSFGAIQSAIDYEYQRQVNLLECGKDVEMETRTFDAASGVTIATRMKEDPSDYRFLRDSDLPILKITDSMIQKAKSTMPSFKDERICRMQRDYKLDRNQILRLESIEGLTEYFESVLQAIAVESHAETAFNWATVELLGRLNQRNLSIYECPVDPRQLASIVDSLCQGSITAPAAKEILRIMFDLRTGAMAGEIAKEYNLLLGNQDQGEVMQRLDESIEELLIEQPLRSQEVRDGKRSIEYFLGPLMRRFRGSITPHLLKEKLNSALVKNK